MMREAMASRHILGESRLRLLSRKERRLIMRAIYGNDSFV